MNGKRLVALSLIAGATLLALRRLGNAATPPDTGHGQPPHQQLPGYGWVDDAGQQWWVTPLADGTLHYTYVCTPEEQAAGRCPEGSLRTLPTPNPGQGSTRQWTPDEADAATRARLDALVAEVADRFGMTPDEALWFVRTSGEGYQFGGPGLPRNTGTRRARLQRAGLLNPPAGPRPAGTIDATSVWRGYEAEGRARWARLADWAKRDLMSDWQSMNRSDWYGVYGYPESAPLALRKVAFNAFVRFWQPLGPMTVVPVGLGVTPARLTIPTR